MTGMEDVWYDEDAGPLVRLYARVGGPGLAARDELELNAIVSCPPDVVAPDGLSTEQLMVLDLSRNPISLSEIAVTLGLPVGPTRLLLGELHAAGLIKASRPQDGDPEESPAVLDRLLSGLRSL